MTNERAGHSLSQTNSNERAGPFLSQTNSNERAGPFLPSQTNSIHLNNKGFMESYECDNTEKSNTLKTTESTITTVVVGESKKKYLDGSLFSFASSPSGLSMSRFRK
eukprot:TRINITY_DN25072_c0_g1_i1.p1 TRINITY_DN25072_c0_g1~~TRINITY_DN25072_c0_g1_i1.p1  ORF type:complete len:107 (+),score=33.63 TRINITY_DN25072_c0_g1_i1:3-323(+)